MYGYMNYLKVDIFRIIELSKVCSNLLRAHRECVRVYIQAYTSPTHSTHIHIHTYIHMHNIHMLIPLSACSDL